MNKPERIRCWKVLWKGIRKNRSGNQDYVGVSSYAERYWKVKYKKGVINNAPPAAKMLGYNLLVFKNKESAIDYIHAHFLRKGEWELWECTGIETELKDKLSIGSTLDSLNSAFCNMYWPKGTIMVKDLELIRKVKGDQK